MPNKQHPLSWEALKGTKTAIHCKCDEEFDTVCKIIGFNYDKHQYEEMEWRYKNHIPLNSKTFTYGATDFYEGYRIIPACDFIAANTVGDAGARDEVINKISQ